MRTSTCCVGRRWPGVRRLSGDADDESAGTHPVACRSRRGRSIGHASDWAGKADAMAAKSVAHARRAVWFGDRATGFMYGEGKSAARRSRSRSTPMLPTDAPRRIPARRARSVPTTSPLGCRDMRAARGGRNPIASGCEPAAGAGEPVAAGRESLRDASDASQAIAPGSTVSAERALLVRISPRASRFRPRPDSLRPWARAIGP